MQHNPDISANKPSSAVYRRTIKRYFIAFCSLPAFLLCLFTGAQELRFYLSSSVAKTEAEVTRFVPASNGESSTFDYRYDVDGVACERKNVMFDQSGIAYLIGIVSKPAVGKKINVRYLVHNVCDHTFFQGQVIISRLLIFLLILSVGVGMIVQLIAPMPTMLAIALSLQFIFLWPYILMKRLFFRNKAS